MADTPLPLGACAARGPYPVGVTSVELPDPERPGRRLPTDVWYPADAGAFEASAPADHPLGAPHAARVDARPADLAEACPLVAFSHGNSGLRRQSTFLTTHLASFGMVVVAPDHSGNTFFEMIAIRDVEERLRVHRDARASRPRDLAAAIAAVLEPVRSRAWPAVDPERIGALGHSFGGWTALKMPAREPRVRAVCGLAPASEPFVGRSAFAAGELPFARSIPSLIVPALDDVLVDLEASVWPLFERLAAPRALVGLRNADHFHFCDQIELLHGFHEKNGMRPRQTRATRPYAELLDEARTQRALRALVTAFFATALTRATLPSGAASGDLPDLSSEALAELGPELARLDVGAEPTALSASR
jgi:predicted dienelactone hydrolase